MMMRLLLLGVAAFPLPRRRRQPATPSLEQPVFMSQWERRP